MEIHDAIARVMSRRKITTVQMNGCVLMRKKSDGHPKECTDCPHFDTSGLDENYCLPRVALLDWPGWTCHPANQKIPENPKNKERQEAEKRRRIFHALGPDDLWTGWKCGCRRPKKEFKKRNSATCKSCLTENDRAVRWKKKNAIPPVPGTCKICGEDFEPFKHGRVMIQFICKYCFPGNQYKSLRVARGQ